VQRRADENWRRVCIIGDVEAVFVEAQKKIGPGDGAAAQFVMVEGIDADADARLLQRPHGVFEMRKRRVRQAAKIDHIGAGAPQFFGAR
jgi:hypothetical protein